MIKEDSVAYIPNLLIDAIAISKLSGLQKGALIYLCRCTYGRGLAECHIGLTEWAKALQTHKPHVSTVLKGLTNKNVILRRLIDRWKGYLYSCNTDISQWDSACINIEALATPRKRSIQYKKHISPALRWAVWERDNFTCQHCGTRQRLSVDHIYPEWKHGSTDLSNLQTLCVRCNNKKGTKVL